MKRTSSTTIRRRGRGDTSVSLFPFLAVLLCAMGALIVVLVVITRQARSQVAQLPVVPEKTQELGDLETAREMAQWRIGELKTSREKTEAQLADVRLQLGSIEDHSRQLREKLAQLQAAWAKLEATKGGDSRQRAQQEAEVARLRGEIEAAKRRLAEAQEASQKRGSYAVVPYEGPNGTHRRPIYLECRGDAVVLQPEGIMFPATDFAGPLGPGNPLDAALRATREHLLKRNQIVADGSNEPYPLLLVRPSGIEAYYAVRAAMKSWGSDFGYELIGDDWKLEFMPPDPSLARTVGEVVDAARVRQRRLAQAVPRYHDQGRPTYRPAPYRGGVVLDSGSPAEATGPQVQTPGARFASRTGGHASGPPGEAAPYDNALSGGLRPEGSSPAGSNGSSSPSGGASATLAQANNPAGTAQQASSPSSPIARRPQEVSRGQGPPSGKPAHLGEWVPQSPSRPSSQPPSEPAAEVEVGDQPARLTESRGTNWGLPNASHSSVPITRPIRVDLYADHLVIVPEQRTSQPKVIPLGSKTVDAVDGMVSSLWELMDSWGIAGRGMYWRPVLNVHVAPGADQRYHDLAALLDGSGLDVQRR